MKRKQYKKKGYLLKIPGKRKQVRVKPQLCKMPRK